jgi:hypothetical protein
VAVRSLSKANALREALSAPSEGREKLHIALDDGTIVDQHDQTSIVQKSGLVPKYHHHRRQSTPYYVIMNEDKEAHEIIRIPEIWSFSVEGDSESEGLNTFPFRFFSSERLSDIVIRSFEAFNDRLRNDQMLDSIQEETVAFNLSGIFDSPHSSEAQSIELQSMNKVGTLRPIRTWDSDGPLRENFRAPPRVLDQYLKLDIDSFAPYPEWREVSCQQWMRFFLANLFGLMVLWGTTGPAIYVMYYSPPVVSSQLCFKHVETKEMNRV